MSSTQVVKIATVTSTLDLNQTGKTDAQVANIYEWFIADWAGAMPEGLTQAQQNQWKADQANRRILDYVIATARANRLKQLKAAQASLEDTATQETQL